MLFLARHVFLATSILSSYCWFIRNSKLLSSVCSTWCQYSATISSFHSRAKAMLVTSLSVWWLECSFHCRDFLFFYFIYLFLSVNFQVYRNSECKDREFMCKSQMLKNFFLVDFVDCLSSLSYCEWVRYASSLFHYARCASIFAMICEGEICVIHLKSPK